jgi:hypothetical protein
MAEPIRPPLNHHRSLHLPRVRPAKFDDILLHLKMTRNQREALKTSRTTARSGEAIADKDYTAEAAGTAGVGVGNSLVPM